MRGVSALAFVVVVLAYAFLAVAFTSHEPGWYASLPRPRIQPPDWVFGVIWPTNFLTIGLVGALVSQRAPQAAVGLFIATVASAACAVFWAYLFYVPHQLTLAAWCLVGSAAFAWLMVILAGRVGWQYGAGLLIYATWMSVATALAFEYARIVPR